MDFYQIFTVQVEQFDTALLVVTMETVETYQEVEEGGIGSVDGVLEACVPTH